ncbi:MAG: SDR family NAD(P)-dependent oxidoreductase, partial [bacterium]|nr:SDR family NAD(P)-dependent oxidoreductase [bacterium]
MSLDGQISPKDFDAIAVGESRSLTHQITASDIAGFAHMTGDQNPIHWDEEFARRMHFRRPVVYGMLSASFLSTAIGTLMPGPGALWTSQTLDFLQPAYEGDTIHVVVRVKQKSPATRMLVLETAISNQDQRVLITGEARVRLLDAQGGETRQSGSILAAVGGSSDGSTPAQEQRVAAYGSTVNRSASMVVIITGASRGIGAAIARELASVGHRVVINFLRGDQDAARL